MYRLPKLRRTGLFSATMTDEVQELARAGLRNAVRVKVETSMSKKQAQATPSGLLNYYHVCPHDHKLQTLVALLMAQPNSKFMVWTCV